MLGSKQEIVGVPLTAIAARIIIVPVLCFASLLFLIVFELDGQRWCVLIQGTGYRPGERSCRAGGKSLMSSWVELFPLARGEVRA